MADRATWVKRVAAWRASGQTAAEFAKEHDFASGTLRWWSSQIGPTPAKPARPAVRIARVVRAAGAGKAAAPSGAAVVVEVEGVRVVVGAGFDHGTLASVVDVLESRRGGAR